MKVLRRVFFIFLGLLALLTVVSFMLPSEAFIKRSVYVRAPQAVVFSELSNFQRFNTWSSWYRQDTAATYTFAGPEEGGLGSEIRWDGEVVEKGRMIIIKTVPQDSIMVEIYFGDGDKPARADFYLSPAGPDSVEVVWIFRSQLGLSPIARYMGLMIGSFVGLGPSYESSLKMLKALLEHKAKAVAPVLSEEQMPAPLRLVGLRSSYSTPEEAGVAITASFEEVKAFVRTQGITQPQYASVYFIHPELGERGPVGYIAGLLLEEGIPLPEDFVTHTLPARLYLSALHMGAHAGLPQAHAQLQAEMQARNYVLDGDMWESYPAYDDIEPDTAKWQTRIYYPVRPAAPRG